MMWNCRNILLFLTLLFACNTESISPEDQDIGLDYYPMRMGESRVYEVQEIHYNAIGTIDTMRYLLRESVVDSVGSGNNETQYIVNQYIKARNKDWERDSVLSVKINKRQVIITESNRPYIKLIFPVGDGKKWNANAFSGADTTLYQMTKINQDFETPDTIYKNTLTVIQSNNEDTLFTPDRRLEVFSKNSGLVYKEMLQLKYCTNVNCFGQKIIETGTHYTQQLVEFKYE